MGELYELDLSVAAPGVGAIRVGADQVAGAHDAHQPSILGLNAARPWGNDAIGQAFSTNYDKVVSDALAAWTEITRDVSDFAVNLERAQNEAWQANQAAGRPWQTP